MPSRGRLSDRRKALVAEGRQRPYPRIRTDIASFVSPQRASVLMPSRDLEARIVELEILLTHQQRDLADMSRQLIEQRQFIDALQQRLAHLEGELPKPAAQQQSPASLYDDLGDVGRLPDERRSE